MKKKQTALAKRDNANITFNIHEPSRMIEYGLSLLSQAFDSGAKLAPEVKAVAFGAVKDVEDTVKKIAEVARNQMLQYIVKNGTTVTEAGTKEVILGNLSMRAVPSKTGYDPTKVEALLRAKNADLQRYMDEVISYKLSASKLTDAIINKVVTTEELSTCRYDEPGYSVHRPKLVKEE